MAIEEKVVQITFTIEGEKEQVIISGKGFEDTHEVLAALTKAQAHIVYGMIKSSPKAPASGVDRELFIEGAIDLAAEGFITGMHEMFEVLEETGDVVLLREPTPKPTNTTQA